MHQVKANLNQEQSQEPANSDNNNWLFDMFNVEKDFFKEQEMSGGYLNDGDATLAPSSAPTGKQ